MVHLLEAMTQAAHSPQEAFAQHDATTMKTGVCNDIPAPESEASALHQKQFRTPCTDATLQTISEIQGCLEHTTRVYTPVKVQQLKDFRQTADELPLTMQSLTDMGCTT